MLFQILRKTVAPLDVESAVEIEIDCLVSLGVLKLIE